MKTLSIVVLIVSAAMLGAPARAGDGGARGFVQLEGGGGLLTDVPGAGVVNVALSYALRGGLRMGSWGLFGQIGESLWWTFQEEGEFQPGTLNVAIGIELRYFKGRAASSLAVGTATLLFDTLFHQAGQTGLFVDLRPVALRYPAGRRAVVELVPISLAVMAPALGDDHNLVNVVYQGTIVLEVGP
jgi:hypothetical protein